MIRLYIVKFPKRFDELVEIIEPYTDRMCQLKDDAPEEIKKAHKELLELGKEIFGNW